MDFDKLTVAEVKQLAAMAANFLGSAPAMASAPDGDAHWKIGKIYLFRTVTHIDTGRLVKVTDKEFVIEDAAWIADTGRFADAIAKAEFGEVEPYPDGHVILGRGALIDAREIQKAPRVQK